MTSHWVASIKLGHDADSKATAELEMTDFQVRRTSQVAQFGEISLDFRKMQLHRADQLERAASY